ncbi:MAG: ATP-binding protein [Oculatellaceae cyanobacterium bins.114]|nr:ATP-binding protein [Oculatellaceae cyanobacterium bins.114]
MNFVRKAAQMVHQSRRQWLVPSSLQLRLTAGITAALVIGLGGVAVWISWTMQQLLVTTHIQNVKYITDRFPHDVSLYHEMLPTDLAVQRAILQAEAGVIDNSPHLLIWVTHSDGKMIAQSESLKSAPQGFQDMLLSLSEMPIQPQVYRVGDGATPLHTNRYLLLYSNPLVVNNITLGQFYLAQDITEEQEMLITAIQQVSFATIVAILLLTIVITIYIRRSLQPLRKMSQFAETISLEELSQARLDLRYAPNEVQELAHMLDKMLSRLARSWEQHRQFVSNVSHELRTPLTVISGYLQSLLRRSSSLTSSQKEALEIAAAETDRTIRLLQDLLELARADSGYLPLRLEPVVLNDLVKEIVGMGEKFSDRTIHIEAEQYKIYIKTDRDRLTQMLINLIDNAVKYSDPGEPIVVSLAQTERCTTIQVIDHGCGIPLQQQTRIFERFYRVDEARARSTGGVGLGLAIVKSLVEGMGGHVTVSSKLGEGSTFTITLPNE